ncbi:hypothetical protein pb186bvf_015409 [Paramecium bursaria]
MFEKIREILIFNNFPFSRQQIVLKNSQETNIIHSSQYIFLQQIIYLILPYRLQ